MISLERAKEIVDSFLGQRILVVGDLMLDRYICGTVNRISPEAPVPVVRVTREHCSPGGAANVAANIQSLGGEAIVAGIVGKDPEAEKLMEIITDKGIRDYGVLAYDGVRTTVKTRILAERQQVVRVDWEDPPEFNADTMRKFCSSVVDAADGVAGVVVEDYGKGVVCQESVDTVLRVAAEQGIPVGLDPKDNHDLKISGIALATPNFKEACGFAGLPDSPLCDEPESDKRLSRAGDILSKKWNPDLLIITLGPHGMYLLCKGEEPRLIPTRAREVFDVSGAGDTVIAAAFLSLVSGANYYEAASLANCAAGVVVGKVGTATCSPEELFSFVEKDRVS